MAECVTCHSETDCTTNGIPQCTPCLGRTLRYRTGLGTEQRPPLTRDALLSEISRSLRATHPDRAEQMIPALERSLRDPHVDCPPCHKCGLSVVTPMRVSGNGRGTAASHLFCPACGFDWDGTKEEAAWAWRAWEAWTRHPNSGRSAV